MVWTCVQELRIGNDCWIGAKAIILAGVQVQDRAVIGAGAVVTRNVEASAIVAATHPDRAPADVVRRLGGRGIMVAHRAGRLRVSPHFYNTFDEIDRLLTGLE